MSLTLAASTFDVPSGRWVGLAATLDPPDDGVVVFEVDRGGFVDYATEPLIDGVAIHYWRADVTTTFRARYDPDPDATPADTYTETYRETYS